MKILFFRGWLLFLFLFNSPVYAVDEMVVYGYLIYSNGNVTTNPSMGLGGLASLAGVGIHLDREARSARDEAKEKREKQKKCNDDADAAGAQCQNAYGQLNSICTALVGWYGGIAANKFFERIGMNMGEGMKFAISVGGGVLNEHTEVLTCPTLTSRAMQFCANGVAKMKNACNQ